MQRLEISGAVRHVYMSLGVKGLIRSKNIRGEHKVFPLLRTFITRKLRGIQTNILTLSGYATVT
jgi:hypothetical protein